jgi:hypothetical protein
MTNPYEASIVESFAPTKPYARFWFILDLVWICFAAGPTIHLILFRWFFGIKYDVGNDSLSYMLIWLCFLLSIVFSFIVSFVANIIGSIKGRRLSILGVTLNVVSMICLLIP